MAMGTALAAPAAVNPLKATVSLWSINSAASSAVHLGISGELSLLVLTFYLIFNI